MHRDLDDTLANADHQDTRLTHEAASLEPEDVQKYNPEDVIRDTPREPSRQREPEVSEPWWVHETVKKEATRGPSQSVYPLLRDLISAGKPKFSIRTPREIDPLHHDMIVNSDRPEYHEENNNDPDLPKVYGMMRSGGLSGRSTVFLAPLKHNETGQTGWVRGRTNQNPDEWQLYRDSEIQDAVAGRVPRRLLKFDQYGEKGDARYRRQWARGVPMSEDTADRILTPPETQMEGDVPLDEEGHQIVEPRRDFIVEPHGMYWTDLNWDDPGDHPLVRTRGPEDDAKPWWAVP